MRNRMKAMAGLIVVSLVASALAASAAEGPKGPRDGARGAARGNAVRGQREEEAGAPGDRGKALGRRVGAALFLAAKQDDAKLKELVDKVLADRKDMLAAEAKRLKAVKDVVDAIRAGQTGEDLKDEMEALKTASENVREAGEKVREDMEAISERLKELGIKPEPPRGAPRDGQGAQQRRRVRGGAGDPEPVIE